MTLLAVDALDLTAFLPTDTAKYAVQKPGGGATGWVIEFAGPSHPKAISWANESARKSLDKARAIEQSQVNGRKYKPADTSVDEQLRTNVQWIVGRVVNWTPVKVGGTVYEFSDATATELLMKPEMGWAFVQLVEFLADERSFTKGSATA
jgi:hypothetical protein